MQTRQVIDISNQQIQQSAGAGVAFLNLESTLIPGNMKRQLAVLETVLTGVRDGRLLVVSPPTDAVESQSSTDDGAEPNADPDDSSAETTPPEE